MADSEDRVSRLGEASDAWQIGFEVTTRTQTADGVVYSRTRVLEWADEGFRMSDRAVSDRGIPLDEEVIYRKSSGDEYELLAEQVQRSP